MPEKKEKKATTNKTILEKIHRNSITTLIPCANSGYNFYVF